MRYRLIWLLPALLFGCDDGGQATLAEDASAQAREVSVADLGAAQDARVSMDLGVIQDAEIVDRGAPQEVSAADSAPQPDVEITPDAAPPACAPAVTLDDRGWPHDGWGWDKLGPIQPDLEGDALAPSVIPWGDGLRMYFTRQDGPTQSLWTATSEDGLSWTAPEPLEGIEGSYPSALARPGGGVRLYFGSGFIERADSDDGVRFSEAETVLSTSALEGALSFIYPHAMERDGALWLYFTYFDGQTFRLARAEGPVGGDALTVTAPILERGDAYDNHAVGQSRVHAHGAGFLMWHGAYDTSMTDPGPWRIALARSEDGLSWTRVGLSVSLDEGDGPDAWSARDPSLIWWRGALWMFYAGLAPDMTLRLLAARAACPEQPELLE